MHRNIFIRRRLKGSGVDTVAVLLVFCVFTAMVLGTIMLCAVIYKNTTEASENGYNEQVGLSYVWTKVKNSDELNKVYIGDFLGLSALCIDEDYDGVTYQTIIYYYDGWIRELFCEQGLEFSVEDGTPVVKADSLYFEEIDDRLIKVKTDYSGVFLSLRSGTTNSKGDHIYGKP